MQNGTFYIRTTNVLYIFYFISFTKLLILDYFCYVSCSFQGEFAAAEEKLNTSSGTPPPCYYTSSESFLSLPYLEKVNDVKAHCLVQLLAALILSLLLIVTKIRKLFQTENKICFPFSESRRTEDLPSYI